MSRWVCLRCFEANEDSFAACQSCGLARGATPAAGEGVAAAADSGPAASSGRGIGSLLLRFWWVGLLLAIPIVGFLFNAQRGDDGSITRSGNMHVSELQVGDCFDLQDEEEVLTDDVTARPCDEDHGYELIFTGSMASGAYPSESDFNLWLESNCLTAFDEYVGVPYEVSTLDIVWFQPTEDGWDQGDHSVQCAAYDPAQPVLSEALRDSAR